MSKKELINKIDECFSAGYSINDLKKFLLINTRSENVINRLNVIVNDLLNSKLKTMSYYSELFHVSIPMIQNDIKLVNKKAKWLMGYFKQYGFLYDGGEKAKVDIRFLGR